MRSKKMSKYKSDGEIYEEVSRKANPELHAQVDAWLDELCSNQVELSHSDLQLIEDNYWELIKDE